MTEYDKPVPTTLQSIAPLLKEVYQERLIEQLYASNRMYARVRAEWTPEQEARAEAAKLKREQERKDLLDLLATATGTVKAIVELHSTNKYDECKGCDYGGWEGEEPSWPCRTIDLITEELRK